MKRLGLYISLPLLVLGFTGRAQDSLLTLQSAISTAMLQNHAIKVAQMQNAANQKDVFAGNAGYYPTVGVNGQIGSTASISDLEFGSPTFPNIENQQNQSVTESAQVQASYVLFNGMGRFYAYQKLKSSGYLSAIQEKISVESTIIQVTNAYYEVVRLQEQRDLLKAVLGLSEDRLKRVKTQEEFGSVSKIELLNAQVDFNQDSSNWVMNKMDLDRAKRQLNYLLGRSVTIQFEIDKTVELPSVDSLQTYLNKASGNNTNLLLTQVQLDMAEVDHKMKKSVYYPTVSSSLSYGFQGQSTEVGVVTKQTSLGLTGTVSLSWNLFDGMKRQKALEKAKILMDKGEVQLQQVLLNIDLEVANAHDQLSTYLILIQMETQNLATAQLNLERSKELFFNGTINNVQFRQAQINLLQIQTKINNYKYLSKIMEMQLLRLTNELVK